MFGSVAFEYTPGILPLLSIVDVLSGEITSEVAMAALLLLIGCYSFILRKRLLKMKKTNQQLLASRSHVVNNISQEVRTPLNAIVGFSEQLSHAGLKEEQYALLKTVENAADALRRVLTNIHELGQIEKGALSLASYPFSLYSAFISATDSVRPKAYGKQLVFHAVYEGDQQLQVTGDKERLEQILVCLLENAISYTDAGSIQCHMQLGKLPDGQVQVNIQVTDTGKDKTAERLPFITSNFNGDKVPGLDAIHSTGLGLSFAQGLLLLHKSRMTVDHTWTEGCRFVCSLTYKVSTIPQTIVITQQEVNQMTGQFMKGRYVLVADDQEMNLVLLEKILTRWECRFDKAIDGAAAYELFTANHYDMILLDLQMPRMTGIEVVKRIRNDQNPTKAHIPVLALTADTSMPDCQEFLNAGFDDYLLKPFLEKEIYNVIIRHLRPLNTLAKATR
jgi:signal transduction histidine kinase/CheY-like chemotaxis protein